MQPKSYKKLSIGKLKKEDNYDIMNTDEGNFIK